jgi:SAM-dependent methyltransferase
MLSASRIARKGGLGRTLRRSLQRAAEATGLIGFAFRLKERLVARERAPSANDGLPVPPRHLITLVAGRPDEVAFSEGGRTHARQILELAKRWGALARSESRVLDFGCGCGRIARWIAADVVGGDGEFIGMDVNPRLVAWCAANLPGRYITNEPKPPLALPAGSLDLVYAYSVLTHLRRDTALAWLSEVRRVLQRDGRAILTFHDEGWAEAFCRPEIRDGMADDNYFVTNDALEGSNYLAAFVTRSGFTKLAAPYFDVLEIVPGGKDGLRQAAAVMAPRAPV